MKQIKQISNRKKRLEGIGGWLIIPTISLFLTACIFVVLTIIIGISISSNIDLLLFLLSIAVTGISIYTLILEFKKSKYFPRWFIIFLWFGVFAVIIMSLTNGDYAGIFSSIIGAGLWTWYTNVSKRIKNTFVK